MPFFLHATSAHKQSSPDSKRSYLSRVPIIYRGITQRHFMAVWLAAGIGSFQNDESIAASQCARHRAAHPVALTRAQLDSTQFTKNQYKQPTGITLVGSLLLTVTPKKGLWMEDTFRRRQKRCMPYPSLHMAMHFVGMYVWGLCTALL
jgi:hypothetical protein